MAQTAGSAFSGGRRGRSQAPERAIASSQRWVMMHELRGTPEPSLTELLARFSDCDLVLVEGYKHAPIAKLEVYRPALGKPLLHPHDRHIVAVASDGDVATDLPRLDLNEPQAITRFICDFLESHHEFTPATP